MMKQFTILTCIFGLCLSLQSQKKKRCPKYDLRFKEDMYCNDVPGYLSNKFNENRMESVKAVLQKNENYLIEIVYRTMPNSNDYKKSRRLVPAKCMPINSEFNIQRKKLYSRVSCNELKSALLYLDAENNSFLDKYELISENRNLETDKRELLELEGHQCIYTDKILVYKSLNFINIELLNHLRNIEISAIKKSDDKYEIVKNVYNPNNLTHYNVITREVPVKCMPYDVPFSLSGFEIVYDRTRPYDNVMEKTLPIRNLYLYLSRERNYIDKEHPATSKTIAYTPALLKSITDKRNKSLARSKNQVADFEERLAIKMKKKELLEEKNKMYEAAFNVSEFSNLPGGKYLFAIYKNNFDKIRELDKGYTKYISDRLDKIDQNVRKVFLSYMEPKNLSMLNLVILEYMHEYKKNPKRCFKEGARSFTFNKTTAQFELVDGYGWSHGTYGGIQMFGHYMVNPEFVKICREKAGVRGWVNEMASSSHELAIGIKELNRTFDCQSPEIKQFEENLIGSFEKYSQLKSK